MTTISKTTNPAYTSGSAATTPPATNGQTGSTQTAGSTEPTGTGTTGTTGTAETTETNESEHTAATLRGGNIAAASAFKEPIDFLTVGHTQTTPTDPLQVRMEAATTSFQSRIDGALNLDAMSMARGETPFRNGDSLSSDQQSELKDAASEFVQDMPLGSLAPKFGDAVRERLNGMGMDIGDINNMSLREVGSHVGDEAGDFAGDMAKGWANDLKDNSPAAFYGILATGAAAVGTYGVVAGSDGLKKLGIDPKFKTNLFNDHVTARAEASWDPMLKNFQASGSVRAQFATGRRGNFAASVSMAENRFSGASISQSLSFGDRTRGADFRATARFDDSGFQEATGYARFRLSPDAQLTGNLKFDDGGFDSAALSGLLRTSPGAALRGTATFNGQGLETLGAAYRLNLPKDHFALSADAMHNFQSEQLTGGLSLRYQPSSNLDFALSGSLNSQGESRIGAGLRFRF